jgi:hypothetical protein
MYGHFISVRLVKRQLVQERKDPAQKMKAVIPAKSAITPTQSQAIYYVEEPRSCDRNAEAHSVKIRGG